MTSNPPPAIMRLFLSFLRLGLTAFGGPAMIAYMRRMAVEKKHWLDQETFKAGVGLCQVIPGATAMQMAAYVGLKARGVLGAAAAFVGFGLPAFMFMIVLSALYSRYQDLPTAIILFTGLQTIIVGIVAHAAVSFGGGALRDWRDILITSAAATLFAFHVSPIVVILLASLAGLLITDAGQKKSGPAAVSSPGQSGTKKSFRLLVAGVAGFFLLLFFVERRYFDLAFLMAKIDLFAFGGGFASIPLMLHELVDVRGWIDSRTFMNGIVLGQVTPGPIVITATFVGYLLYGIPGGAIATAGIFLPSFLIVVGIAPYFERLRSSPYFNRAIHGILCSFVGLLLRVVGSFAAGVHWDAPHLGLFAATFAALYLKVDILWVFLGGTIIALLV
jgi:chromate transporter